MLQSHPADENKAIKDAAKTLAHCADTVVYAINEHHGVIRETAENQTVITRLLRHHLGYFDAELGGLVLHSVVRRFVRHQDSRYKFRQTSREIVAKLDEIEEKTLHLRKASQYSEQDAEFFRCEVQEAIGELAELLLGISQRFASQVYDEMNAISDLRLRIHFNEVQLKELKKLNDILINLNANKIAQMSAKDVQLKQLLHKWLVPILEICHNETIIASTKLNDELLRHKQELQSLRRLKLIDGFLRQYQKNPQYRPSELSVVSAPQCFYHSSQTLTAYADWQNVEDYDDYVAIAVRLTKPKLAPKTAPPEPVQTVSIAAQDVISETTDGVTQCLQWVFEALQAGSVSSLSGIQTFQALCPPVDLPMWLLALTWHYHGHEKSFSPKLILQFQGEVLANYNGNQLIYDVIINRA